jgi:outer membrane protein assembly factor BamB
MPAAETYFAKSTAIAARMLGDETIIMSTVDSTIFMLNPTGTVIWNAADGTTPLSRIIEEKVCVEFDVPIEQASADAQDFVDELAEHGVLVVSDEPIPPTKEAP